MGHPKPETPLLAKLLELISRTSPPRLILTPSEYVQLRSEVLQYYDAIERGAHIMPPPDELTGYAGQLYGIPIFIGREDPLIEAAQRAADQEKDLDGSDRSSDR